MSTRKSFGKKLFFALCGLLGVALLFLPPTGSNAAKGDLVHAVKISGAITPATYELISRHIKIANDRGATALVLEMHTPGGLYDSTQEIIQDILDAPIPVITYVSPSGSHAASAGTYILYASHIAAMAPGTNIGAATPVQMGGGMAADEEKTDDKKKKEDNTAPATNKDALSHKMVNDATAYIKTLAELRGRNIKWAEKAVRKAETLTASEALKEKVIDAIADDIQSLLADVDGKTVKMARGATMELKTKDAKIAWFEPDWRTKILEIISHPNVAFLLMSIGGYGLIYEMANPGAFFPGVIGAISLLLALYAMNVLPVNYTGVLLIFLGIALMTGEAFVPSFGVLGIGGAIAFAGGAIMLIDSSTPGFGVDPWLIALLTALSIGMLSFLLSMLVKSHNKTPETGQEELLSAIGEVVTWLDGKGDVRVTGEVWQARTEDALIIKAGDKVKVVKIEGLCLIVEPHNT
ncbi:MAG: nodulation protein NfeD [Alphaproteobacteria bacterium]|nr:nodulation protein NfeD [Alphaproteobacteria bacterium]